MAVPSVNDIVRIGLQWFTDGTDELVNVHTFKVIDPGTATDAGDWMTQLVLLLSTDLYDIITDIIADNILGGRVSGYDLTAGTVLPPVENIIDGVNTAGGDAYARQVAALVYLNSDVPRRQARSYLPPFVEAYYDDDGYWNASALPFMLDYAVKLLDPITDGDMSVRRVIAHSDGSVPLIPTQAGFSLAPRTQRRRTPGRGS